MRLEPPRAHKDPLCSKEQLPPFLPAEAGLGGGSPAANCSLTHWAHTEAALKNREAGWDVGATHQGACTFGSGSGPGAGRWAMWR